MAEKDGKPPVNGDSEKGKEETERLQKRVEELSSALESEKQGKVDLQERIDEVEREKSRLTRRVEIERIQFEAERKRAEIEKEQLDDVTERLEKEKKKREESDAAHKEKEKALLREKGELRGKSEVLMGKKEVLRGEVVGLRRTLDECESEKKRLETKNEELMKRMKEMEEKLSAHVKGTGEISTQTDEIPALNFLEDDLKYEMDFNEEELDNKDVDGLGYEMNLGDEINFKEEETPNDNMISGMGDADIAMNNSFSEPPFNNDFQDLGNPSDGCDTFMAEENPMNGMLSIAEEVDSRISQSEDSHETGEVERKKRPSRNSSKSVKYTDSIDDSGEDGKPSVKKSKLDSGKMSGIKRQSSLKKDQSVSARKGKRNDKELDCFECEYRTRSVTALMEHLRFTHKTNFILAGLALLCACGNESYSYDHSYKCNIADFTVVRKRDGPIRRLDDKKVTPQCILCEVYPKTAVGYAWHLRKHHDSTLRKNGIHLICSCGLGLDHNERLPNHNKECNGRLFTLRKLDEK